MNKSQTRIICSATAFAMLGGCSAFQPQARLEIRSVESVQQASADNDALAEGRARLNLGQNANAISAFRAALRENPESGEAYNGLAIAYDRIGRNDLAQRYFELAVSFEPENQRFRNNLARLFDRNGQPQLAAGLIERPVAVGVKSPETAESDITAQGALQQRAEFVAALPASEPLPLLEPVTVEVPSLAALALEGTTSDIVAEPTTLPIQPSTPVQANATVMEAIYRPKAAMTIRPASIEPSHLPKKPGNPLPANPLDRQPFDIPRSVSVPVQRSGARLERVSLGEVRLVTKPDTPVAVAQSRDFESFGVRLATWLPSAIAVEQAGRTAHVAAGPNLQEAIARAKLENAIKEVEASAKAAKEADAFTYAFFAGDDLEKVSLAAL